MTGDRAPAPTLGDLVAANPAAAAFFERLGIDYCCGGAQTLDDACAHSGLDAQTVQAILDTIRAEDAGVAPDSHDLVRATFRELCEHIVVRHHGPLRVALTRDTKLLDTVVRVHGAARPELLELREVFATLRAELEEHLRLEEDTLFPACVTLDGVTVAPVPDKDLLEHLRDDHQSVGAALGTIRTLCDDFDETRALCATHRELLRSLHSFELELHQHVHEENNVLFPRVQAFVGSRG